MSKHLKNVVTADELRTIVRNLLPELHDADVREVLVFVARKIEARRIQAQAVRDSRLSEEEAIRFGEDLLR